MANPVDQMRLGDCPTLVELKQYVLGDVPPDLLASMSAHTLNCAKCQSNLSTFEAASDKFVSRLKAALSTERSVGDPLLEMLIDSVGSLQFVDSAIDRDAFPSPRTTRIEGLESGEEFEPTSRVVTHRIDSVCDEFETEWRESGRPSLENFLNRLEKEERPDLFRELLDLDIFYRRQAGERPLAYEYIARFPTYARISRQADFDGKGQPGDQAEADFEPPAIDSPEQVMAGRPASAEATVQYQPSEYEVLGHFELIDIVGHGAFGNVWKGRDTKLRRPVAIKVPKKESMAAHHFKLFLHEARAAAQLRHPNIVAIHEIQEKGPTPYIVSDFIDGKTLQKWLTENTMSAEQAARFCVKIARALHHAHTHGVVHRDVKPANILLDQWEEPHLTDFGLAKRDAGESTIIKEGSIVGTALYMPPEQARGQSGEVAGTADTYALGVILYELLTGTVPFRGPLEVVLEKIIKEEPRHPRKIDKNIPRDLETICLKAIEKAPARRFSTAEEFAADLERYLEGKNILARRTPWTEQAARWVKRNKMLTTSGLVTAGLASFLFIVLSTASPPPSTRRMRLTTEPAGAAVSFIPMSKVTGFPDPGRIIQPKQKTPLAIDLPPGDYLVVAVLENHGFHEVYRHVPDEGENTPYYKPHRYYSLRKDGAYDWIPIKIPREEVVAGMALIQGKDDFVMGKGQLQHHRAVPSYFLDTTEFTVGEFRRLRPEIMQEPPDSVRFFNLPNNWALNRITFDDAMCIAEESGKRLPDETEFEFAATFGGTRQFPWGNSNISAEKVLEFGPVGTPHFDHLDTNPPVFGLCSNVAEWTCSTSQMYPTKGRQIANDRNQSLDLGIVRGGTGAVIDGIDPGVTPESRDPTFRGTLSRSRWKPGLGLRCARSLRPRLRPEDFVRILPPNEIHSNSSSATVPTTSANPR